MRVSNIHVISALCGVAGVVIAAFQTFGRSDAVPLEVKVEVSAPSAENRATGAAAVNGDTKSANRPQMVRNITEVTPTEPAGLPVASLDRARFLPATRPDTPSRFALSTLFDGNPSTYLKLTAAESDIDFIIEFPFTQPLVITGVEIDTGEENALSPEKLEVMVLPSGSMEGSGRSVTTINIIPGRGVQKFLLPPAEGKSAWIRIAAPPGASETIIGDLKLITAAKQ